MAEHTPTPWKVDARFAVIFSKNDQIGIADCRTVDTNLAVAKANADRAVACVNFCAGTDNEFLSGAVSLDRFLLAAKVGADAELVALLRELLNWDQFMGGWDSPVWDKARATLARLEAKERTDG